LFVVIFQPWYELPFIVGASTGLVTATYSCLTKARIQDPFERSAVYASSLRARCSAGRYLPLKRVFAEMDF